MEGVSFWREEGKKEGSGKVKEYSGGSLSKVQFSLSFWLGFL